MSMMSFVEAQKMFERYWNKARELDYVFDKVAWALYQTWKEAESKRLVWQKEVRVMSDKENEQ